MDKTTIVLPSARAIRHEQNSFKSKSLFLPNFITINEFMGKLSIVDDFKPIDADTRMLLLLKASEFDSFKELQIQRNFFAFTKNSSYIFKFFEELSAELYDIDKLLQSDTYAEYEEHIEILKLLYKRYESLCIENRVLDKIFIPKLYRFNDVYASSHDSVEIYVNGHLTNFEFELLDKLSLYTDVTIKFFTTNFNKKMQEKFNSLGFELESGYEYLLSYNEKLILSRDKIVKNKNITCQSFSESLLQVAFVKQKIYEYVKKGYKAENIAVILPDESSAKALRVFDKKYNFNFAMGSSITDTQFYQKIDATLSFLDQNTKENSARLDRVGDELYEKFVAIYRKQTKDVDIISVLNDIKEFIEDKTILEIYEEELFRFSLVIISKYLLTEEVELLVTIFASIPVLLVN